AGSLFSSQVAYWAEALAGLPEVIDLPTDRPRPAVASHRGAGVSVSIPPGLHKGLLSLAGSGGASLFMVLEAGLAALLWRLGAGDDIAIGSPIAGRTDRATEEMVGFFVNTLVLRTDLSGDHSFAGVIAYAGDLFDPAGVAALWQRLLALLEAAVADPDRALRRIDVLSAAERRRLLVEVNDTAAGLPAAGLPELFEAQVRATPQ